MEDDALKDDVHSFASKLGFTVPGQSFDFSDFEPGSKKIENQPKRKFKDISGSDQKGRQAKSRKKTEQTNAGQQSASARGWISGSGARPGEKLGKGLLHKDSDKTWYEILDEFTVPDRKRPPLKDVEVESLRNEGEMLLEEEAKHFEARLKTQNKTDYKWLERVKVSGTSSDKLAAASLLIKESPLSSLKHLDELLRWVSKRSGARQVAGEAILALKELFADHLLPNRKLQFFQQQPLQYLHTQTHAQTQTPKNSKAQVGGSGGSNLNQSSKKFLLLFYFEDALKKRYRQFVQSLEEASRDQLSFIKEKSMKTMKELLMSKAEQEVTLLTALVKKFGDPSRRIASNAGFMLTQLLDEHPVMKEVVVKEVESVYIPTHKHTHTHTRTDEDLALRLIGLYLNVFHLITKGKFGFRREQIAAADAAVSAAASAKKAAGKKLVGKGKGAKKNPKRPPLKSKTSASKKEDYDYISEAASVDSRLLVGLIAGVRRAFPFVRAAAADDLLATHADSLFRATHSAAVGVAIQALGLLFQFLDTKSETSDRFYRALYDLLLSPELAKTNKINMFLSLLFRAWKADVSSNRVMAFTKRVLQDRPSIWHVLMDSVERITETQNRPNAFINKQLDADGNTKQYDMLKREPMYSGAELSCLWELIPLRRHIHPSVARMSESILRNERITYSGNPLQDFSVAAFLDKFIQKNPKTKVTSSVMQPLPNRSYGNLEEVLTNKLAGKSAVAAAVATTSLAAADVGFVERFEAIKSAAVGVDGGDDECRKKRKKSADAADENDLDDVDIDQDMDEDELDRFLNSVEEDDGTEVYDYANLADAFADEDLETADGDDEMGDVEVDLDGADVADDESDGELELPSTLFDVDDEDDDEGRDDESNADVGSDGEDMGANDDGEDSSDVDLGDLPEPSDESEALTTDDEAEGADDDDDGQWIMLDDLKNKSKSKSFSSSPFVDADSIDMAAAERWSAARSSQKGGKKSTVAKKGKKTPAASGASVREKKAIVTKKNAKISKR